MKAKMITAHKDLGDDDYHEMFVDFDAGRIRADKRGRPNPRMGSGRWLKIICNNPDCYGWGIVHEDAVVALLAEVTA